MVTCGPFHPLLALPQLPKQLPVWVDLPSDPLADIHSQWLEDPHSEATITAHAMAKLALESAMVRGDHFGLISPELRLSFLGQLLLLVDGWTTQPRCAMSPQLLSLLSHSCLHLTDSRKVQ